MSGPRDAGRSGRIDPGAAVAAAALVVSDGERAERFYADVLGFTPLARGADSVVLGVDGVPLLALAVRPGARPKPRRSTGLYHVALLVPTRRALAAVLRRIAAARHPLHGAADHLVSEALYLSDPDGNGLEIAVDRPRETWRWDGDQVRMATDALDLDGLLALGDDADVVARLPGETRIGHVHLHVAALPAAERFYAGTLGFDVTQRSYPGALFVAAGGYHHHLGLNTWAGIGAPPPPADAVGLRRYLVTVSDDAALRAVAERLRQSGAAMVEREGLVDTRDPDGVALRLARRAPVTAADAVDLTAE